MWLRGTIILNSIISNSIGLLIVKYSLGSTSVAYGSQVLESLTISLFGTGDAGTPGNHRSEDFPAPSQDRPEWPVSHHMIPPICCSIIAKLFVFLSRFLYKTELHFQG